MIQTQLRSSTPKKINVGEKSINLIQLKKNSFIKAKFNKDKKNKIKGTRVIFQATKQLNNTIESELKNNKMLEDEKKIKKGKQKTKETIYTYGILTCSYLNHLSIKYIMIL